jgi:hypothetical protein
MEQGQTPGNRRIDGLAKLAVRVQNTFAHKELELS